MATINTALLLAMTLLGALGGYFFKRASSHPLGVNQGFLINLCTGGFFYVSGAILNIILLKFLPYTIVYPLTAITYFWTMLLSYFLLRETMTWRKIAGVTCIVLGAVLLIT